MDKFPKTVFSGMAANQLKKMINDLHEQSANNHLQTEVIKESKTIESPNF